MLSNARIGLVDENLTVTSLYCHYDGNLSHTGTILNNFYKTQEHVLNLLSMGNIFALHIMAEMCPRYSSTKCNHPNIEIKNLRNFLNIPFDTKYLYLPDENWYYVKNNEIYEKVTSLAELEKYLIPLDSCSDCIINASQVNFFSKKPKEKRERPFVEEIN